MSVIISWEQLLTPTRLPSNDIIRLTPVPGYNSFRDSRVEFIFSSAPRITWEKRLRFFDAHGDRAFLQTRDASHRAGPISFPTNNFSSGGLRIELVKAMGLGTLTGVYELTNVGRWKARTLLFEWLED
jgi:hypothetical protein